ncbi:chorismate-binding protein [Kocuria sp. M1N1S27]|uniref:chorismate-binding protein n=1 Tax=Kocuria kalidii TaxID=3376283 RepID=UPI0037AF0A53
MTAPHASEHDFALAAGDSVLLATRNRSLPAVPATRELADEAMAVLAGLDRDVAGSVGRAGRPVLCGTIPFDPDEPADLFVAQHPVRVARPVPTRPVAPGEGLVPCAPAPDPDHREAVAEALDRIDRGALRQVVLGRSLDVGMPPGVGPAQLWEQLLLPAAGGHAFSVRPADGGVLVGAGAGPLAAITPEGFTGDLCTGAARRRLAVSGDAAAQQSLLRSPPHRLRHALVVEHAVRALERHTVSLTVPGQPSVLGTAALWRLATRVTGRPVRGTSALHAALALHPGPAVGGTPTRAALSLIRELEPCRRGPWAGLVGWTDAAGHGRWVPVLRCALLEGGRARLWAGAGVVAGTTVDAAQDETDAKLGVLRAALAAAGAAAGTGAVTAAGTGAPAAARPGCAGASGRLGDAA